MTPRTEVEFLDADLPVTEAQAHVSTLEHSRYPVRGQNDDDVLGFVHVRDLLNVAPDVRVIGDLVRQVPFFPTGKRVIAAMTEMRTLNAHLAIVVDEYGGTDGIVTLEDVVEEFVGEIHDEYDRPAQAVQPRDAGDEVAGLLSRAEVVKALDRELPEGPFDTFAGFLVTRLGRMPEVGDTVLWDGLALTVVGLDGRRVDRVQVREAEDGPDSGDGREALDAPGAGRQP